MEHKNHKIMCPDCGIVMQWTAHDNPVVMKLCVDCQAKHFQAGHKCAVCGEPATKYIQVFYEDGTVAQQYFCITHNFLNIQEDRPLLGISDATIEEFTDIAEEYRKRLGAIPPIEHYTLTHGGWETIKLPDNLEPRGTYPFVIHDEAKELPEDFWENVEFEPSDNEIGISAVPTTNLWSKWLAQVVKDHLEDDELPHHTFEVGRDELPLGTAGIEKVISTMGIEVNIEEEE